MKRYKRKALVNITIDAELLARLDACVRGRGRSEFIEALVGIRLADSGVTRAEYERRAALALSRRE